MTDPNGDLLLVAQEEFSAMADSLTGMKKQLMDRGWSEANAEAVILQVLSNQGES